MSGARCRGDRRALACQRPPGGSARRRLAFPAGKAGKASNILRGGDRMDVPMALVPGTAPGVGWKVGVGGKEKMLDTGNGDRCPA